MRSACRLQHPRAKKASTRERSHIAFSWARRYPCRGVRSCGNTSQRVRPRIAGYSSRWMRPTQSNARAACLQSVQVRSSPHCWVRPLDRSTWGLRVGWAGGSRSVRPPARLTTTLARGAGRGTSPRDSRCRRARGRAGPSGRRRGGTSPGSRARGRVPTGGGGETSVARMAPEASSVTVSQQMRWPVANGTFSTASTCQISWGWTAWGTTTAAARRRRGRLTPARTKASWRVRTEGRSRSCAVLAELESDQPGAPDGVFSLEIAGDAEQFLDWRGDRTTTGAIVGSQSLAIVSAVQPPDVPDRAIGDCQVGRDLVKGRPCWRRRTIS